MLIVLGFLLISEMLQELAFADHWSFLDRVTVFLFGLLCCYPLLLAYETLKLTLESYGEQPSIAGAHGRSARRFFSLNPNIVTLIVFWFGALAAGWVGSWGEPALGLSQLIVLVGWTYLVTVLISFNTWERTDNPGCDDLSLVPARSPDRKKHIGLGLIILAILTMPLWPPGGLWQAAASAEEIARAVVGNWILGFALLAFGTLQRGSDLLFLMHELQQRWLKEGGEGENAVCSALRASAAWHLIGSTIPMAIVVTSSILDKGRLWTGRILEVVVLASAVILLWIIALAWRRSDYKSEKKDGLERLAFGMYPRPRVLVGIKALVLLIIGLQLVYPLVLSLSPVLSSALTSRASLLAAAPSSFVERLSHGGSAAALFGRNADESLWLTSCAMLLLLLVFLEYEWIVRPYAKVRDDVSIHGRPQPRIPRDAETQHAAMRRVPRRVRAEYQRLAEQTFFWKTFLSWLPVLVVPVNLGFDQLDHRLVIEAMLAGMKDAYRRAFLHWSSAFVAVQRFLWMSVLFLLAIAAAQTVFDVDIPEAKPATVVLGPGMPPPKPSVNFCESLISSRANWLLCSIGGEPLIRFLHWAPFRSPRATQTAATHPSLWLYDFIQVGGVPRPAALRIYHMLVFGLAYLLWTRLRRALPITPYQQIYQRVSRQLDSLSSRLRLESRPDRSKWTEWLGAITGRESFEEKEFGPFDPRTVELSFLRILADSQNAGIHFPFATRHRISPPVPELIFVFDELDKIGVGVPSLKEPKSAEVAERQPMDVERERSRSLFKLFADLKNILSSGVARFIFIGGRNLHDEWLADQSARLPLLTNIFDAEIYIPSLLTDEIGRQEGDPLLGGVRLFVSEHLLRAQHLHRIWLNKTMGPWLRLWVEERRAVTFVQGRQEEDDGETSTPLTFYQCNDGETWDGGPLFYDSYIEFLSYRSRGNPKRLKELLESFLRPVERVVTRPQIRRNRFDCEHVLLFRDRDRFRVELVADIFRQIRPIFEERLRYGDDKLGQGIFYLSDFLLKFHRRAFTWSNLERVDELVHIHRAPDLRAVLEALVLNWSERYLHLINNGMYDFRFESDFARELDYLSRQSEHELAALNFTLDESQSLKIQYQARLAQLHEEQAFDFLVGLGELHEFDEEYEIARYYYQRAVRAVDQEFRFQVGDRERIPVSFEVLRHGEGGFEAARKIAIWGVARVRLMLQIGMTYERSRDWEHAHVEYRDARTLASAIIRALLGWKDDSDEGHRWAELLGSRPSEESGYLWTLKHLNILLHPIFAEAWLNEKSVSGVDTGPSLLERELWNLRNMLPFVSAEEFPRVAVAVDAVDVQHSNFSLTFAELHNKAGSLYFFKGRQLVPPSQAVALADGDSDALQGTEGYLLKALSHYAISLHELRRFNHYRRESSQRKLNDYARAPKNTLRGGMWPEFVHRVASGALGNLAESLLARVSLVGLRQTKNSSPATERTDLQGALDALHQEIRGWLETHESSASAGSGPVTGIGENWGHLLVRAFPNCAVNESGVTSLSEWFGAFPGRKRKDDPRARQLLEFKRPHSDAERLSTSISFSLSAARILEEDGYFEGASREYLRVVRTVSHYIWCWNLLNRLDSLQDKGKVSLWKKPFGVTQAKGIPPILEDLLSIAVETIDHTQELFRRSRRLRLRTEATLPLSALTLTCSLALGALVLLGEEQPSAIIRRIRRLLPEVSGETDSSCVSSDWFRGRLMESLDRNSFPMIHRLHGLKVLIDDALIRGPEPETEEHIGELLKLEEMFKSPLHFSPLNSGLTLGLAYLRFKETMEKSGRVPGSGRQSQDWYCIDENRLLEDAKHRLSLSQQMYTMKRTYYEMISGLYYLYDDFNDRTIHYNHAIQMGGAELSSYMLSILDARS